MTDASSLMGPLLLKGWAMGAETCDEDFTPLMIDKKNKGSVCCSCEGRLAKLIVDGCNIRPDGPAWLVENNAGTVRYRVRKEQGLFKFVGELKDVSAPKPAEASAKKEEIKTSAPVQPTPPVQQQPVARACERPIHVDTPAQPQDAHSNQAAATPAPSQPKQLSETQQIVVAQLEKKQKLLAMALDSINDFDGIKELLSVVAEIENTIKLIKN